MRVKEKQREPEKGGCATEIATGERYTVKKISSFGFILTDSLGIVRDVCHKTFKKEFTF